MDYINILELGVLILGIISMYSPWFQLSKSKRVKGKELSQQYPEYAWIRWGFPISLLAFEALITFIFYIIFAEKFINYQERLIYPITLLFTSVGLFIGLFAVITSVCLLPLRQPLFFYVVGDEAQNAGRFQVRWSLMVMIISIALIVFRA